MSTKEILQQIHDEADHIIGYEDDNKLQVAVLNARVIKRLAKQALLPPRPLKIKKWLRSGELSKSNRTQAALIEECGRALDKNNACDILGDVLFKATDGKYYVVTVEALIQEANSDYVTEVLKEKADQ